jgi:4-amino-4-deoxy-L-arabinose transferase-like glycosyltransferase
MHESLAGGDAVRRASSAFRWSVVLAAVVGLAVRVSYVIFVTRYDHLLGDEAYFHQLPTWLSEGYGFHVPHTNLPWGALHPPLYPLLLTPVTYIASGDALLAQHLASALAGTVTVVVIGLVGREVAGERVGVFAAFLAALIPTLWVNDGLILAESLAALMIALALLTGYRLARAPKLRTALLLGVVCGFAALTRGEMILLLLFVGVPVVARVPGRSLRLRVSACAVAATLAVIVPWSAYNTVRFHRLVVVSTNLGMTLCGANNQTTYSGSQIGLWNPQLCPSHGWALNEAAQNTFWTRTSFAYAVHHSLQLPVVALARLARMLGIYAPAQTVDFEQRVGARPTLVSWAIVLLFPLIVGMALYGIVILRRQHSFVTPLIGTLVMAVVFAITISADLRLRVPADVALVILAAVAVDHLTRNRPPGQSSHPDSEPNLAFTASTSETT